MNYIGSSKIGTIRSKPNVRYPMIRLPQEYSEIIGKRAYVYKTDHEGQPAFLVAPNTQEITQFMADTNSRVSKPSLETNTESRLSAIESQITDLKSLILKKESSANSYSKKEAPESGFEPESEPRQGSMIGRYTTRACISAVTA